MRRQRGHGAGEVAQVMESQGGKTDLLPGRPPGLLESLGAEREAGAADEERTRRAPAPTNELRCSASTAMALGGMCTVRTPAPDFGGPMMTAPLRLSPKERSTRTVPAVRSTSSLRSPSTSPRRRVPHAARTTAARSLAGIACSRDSTWATVGIERSCERSAPAPRMRQGLRATRSSVTAVLKIARRRR